MCRITGPIHATDEAYKKETSVPANMAGLKPIAKESVLSENCLKMFARLDIP